MRVEGVTPILNVSDVRASFAWFALLGWRTGFTWPAGDEEPGFASVCSGHAELFLCRGGQGSQGSQRPQFPGDDATDGVWMTWWVATPADVDAAHALAVEHGLDVSMPPRDEPWNVREFHLRHPDGHTFRVSCGIGEDAEHDHDR